MTKQELMRAIKIKGNEIIIKGIDLSKMSIEIDENIGGNLKTLDIGGNNSQGTIGGNNYQLNIEGNNDQNNIGGWNDQGNIGWDNEQGSIGGDNDQRDIGGYNYQLNIGRWSQNSKHYVNTESTIKSTDIDYTDGVLLHSIKVRKLKGGLEYIEGVSMWGEKIYLVKTPNMSYHSRVSLEDAKDGFRRKKKLLLEELSKWVKTLTDDTIITRELFHEETGSCMPGINAWCKKVGISDDTKKITFKEFKEHATNHPTRETKQVMIVLEELKGEK